MDRQNTESYVVTGHREIDSQHQDLDRLIGQFDSVCARHDDSTCDAAGCPEEYRAACNERLANLLGDLLAFIVDHFAYEEKLMRRLPPTLECRQHIEAHKHAHAELSRHLSELAFRLDKENPKRSAARLHGIIDKWMGAHMGELDVRLVRELEAAEDTELNLDVELAKLLETTP